LVANAAFASPGAPRTAIVVGAIAPVPGRAVLRHAYRDAEAIRDALVSVGGYAPDRVIVLRDPEPAALLALVTQESSALANVSQGLLFFYFSGHADGGALYSAGKPVSIEALRGALDRPDVSLRLGLIDACQGGGWTRAKGLAPDAPFEVVLPKLLASEGSALISSSSGSESAHESDRLEGSFFTHHFVAAMRGAGDDKHHGEVTLTDAFEYARGQTIRETARRASEAQHPSFAINLKGRQDVVLAQLASSPSSLVVEQDDGPIELIHLGTGLRLLELPPGRRQVTVAVPPGTYMVRKVASTGVVAREVVVPNQGSARVSEHDLVLVGTDQLVLKGGASENMTSNWPPNGGGEFGVSVKSSYQTTFDHWELGTGSDFGVGSMVRFDGRYGLTDRLAWKIGTLALAYRLGERGGVEVVPYAGLLSWKVRMEPVREYDRAGYRRGGSEAQVGGGIGVRAPFFMGAVVMTLESERLWIGGTPGYQAQAALGLSLTAGPYVTIHVAVAYVRYSLPFRPWIVQSPAGTSYSGMGGSLSGLNVGSVQDFGLESLPLLRLGPWKSWALDFFAEGGEYQARPYRLGISRRF
jgi:hypothetical protein